MPKRKRTSDTMLRNLPVPLTDPELDAANATITDLKWQAANWERKESERATCCWEMEQERDDLKAKLAEAESAKNAAEGLFAAANRVALRGVDRTEQAEADNARLHEILDSPELLESLADIEHKRWVGWMDYLVSKSTPTEQGVLIPHSYAQRWAGLCNTSYADLSEHSKEADRKEVRTTLVVIRAALAAKDGK